jgi:exportin-2 (importin alpha re-exporter)
MREWEPDTEVDKICLNDRNVIKVHIVELMLTAPSKIQKQLSQALAIISTADFPAKWESLLPELVTKMAGGDFNIIIGALETVNSIFHRYRYEAKSQKLWEEIKFVLDHFQEPLTAVFEQSCKGVVTHAANPEMLKKIFQALELECQVFHSLNFQDIPEFFEEKMSTWFGSFQHFLKYTNPALAPRDPEQPGPVELVQTAICESVLLYTNKYEDEFKEHVPVFVNEIWTLLARLDESARYDGLATTAIRFLTSVVKQEWQKKLFDNEAALKTICEKVVIPQLKLRETDVELFQTDGLEYIRRDIEGSDIDTRRRTTVDFVQGLCHHFEARVTAILKNYVGVLLKEYAANKAKNWVAKDAAMYVVLALAVKGQTRSAGATATNPYVDLMSFLQTEVLPELQGTNVSERPVLKADCLKFVSTFRFQLPKDAYPVLLPLLVRHLASEEYVIHTYAAAAIERLLSMKDKGVLRCGRKELQPVLQGMLEGLFKVLEMDESMENPYIMKCIMRVCVVAETDIASFASVIINRITVTLGRIAQNPRSPQFNHYLFETLACLIMNLGKVHASSSSCTYTKTDIYN